MRSYCWILFCFLLCAGNVTCASETTPERPYKIMMLLYRGTTDAEKGFMAYFNRRHINAEFIVRDAQADNSKIQEFIQEAKRIRPDLIYTFGTTMTADVVGLAGKTDPTHNITDIPVVFDIVADPVGAGLVQNLKASGRNLTGASHLVPISAQIDALEAMRKTRTLGVIYNPEERNSVLAVRELQALAPKNNLTILLEPVGLDSEKRPNIEGIETAMHDLLSKKPQFVYIPSDSFLIKNARTVTDAAQESGTPVFAATEAPIRNDGALLGLVSNYYNVGELAAYKAEQILVHKVSVGSIPIEVLNRFTYLVNMSTAKKLKLFPPVSVFRFAEIVSPLENVDPRE